MLVLTRRVLEEIVIDEDIHVVVLQAKRGRVRIGISAPPSIRIDRLEARTLKGESDAHGDCAEDEQLSINRA